MIKKINATKKFTGAIIVTPKRTPCTKTHHMMHGLLKSVHLFCAQITLLPNRKIQCFSISQTPTKVPFTWKHLHHHVIHVPWT